MNHKHAVFPLGQPLHPKPKDALKEIMCEPVEGFELPHMNCVLRRCDRCPKFSLLQEEKLAAEEGESISFHVYQTVTRCSLCGVLDCKATSCVMCDKVENEKNLFPHGNTWHF